MDALEDFCEELYLFLQKSTGLVKFYRFAEIDIGRNDELSIEAYKFCDIMKNKRLHFRKLYKTNEPKLGLLGARAFKMFDSIKADMFKLEEQYFVLRNMGILYG